MILFVHHMYEWPCMCRYKKMIYRSDYNSCIVLLHRKPTSVFLLHNTVLMLDKSIMESIELRLINSKELYLFFPQNYFLFEFSIFCWFLIPKKNLSHPTNNCFHGFILVILLNPTLRQFKNLWKYSQIKCQVKNIQTYISVYTFIHIWKYKILTCTE